MLCPVPAGIDPVGLASVSDNVLDGYRTVAPHLEAQPGAEALVVCHGSRSIALYAVQAALALGASKVDFASDDADARALASRLGARAIDVVRAVVSGGMTAPAVGMVVGLGIAIALTRVLERLLVDVSALDPLTFGGVVVLLTTVALGANWLPARRAARIDPAATLKD